MHDGRSIYSGLCFFQDALSYLVILLLSFPIFIKTAFYGSAHSKQSYEYIPVYPSLQTESVASSCTFDYGLDFYLGEPDVKGHPSEIHETLDDTLAIIPNLLSSIFPSWYKLLQFPSILHDFPMKYYKYLPKFDEESKKLTAEKMYKLSRISLTFLR